MKKYFTSVVVAGLAAVVLPIAAHAAQSSDVVVTPSFSQSGNVLEGYINYSLTTSSPGYILDFEVYNAEGAKVFQDFHDYTNIVPYPAGTKGTQYFSWTVSDSASYTVKVGLFTSGWTQNLYWNNSVITVSGGKSDLVVDAWWPVANATISGVQPFKAILKGLDVGSYTMSWDVDGGRSNPMYDSFGTYPHKEAMVDLSGWTWKGNGPYTITFTAFAPSGRTIASASVPITVTH